MILAIILATLPPPAVSNVKQTPHAVHSRDSGRLAAIVAEARLHADADKSWRLPNAIKALR